MKPLLTLVSQFSVLINLYTSLHLFSSCHVQESDYFTPQGEFRVDKAGSPTLLNCLMYKMSYYRFGEMQVRSNQDLTLTVVFLKNHTEVTSGFQRSSQVNPDRCSGVMIQFVGTNNEFLLSVRIGK